ncbi:hypothetical protein ACSMXN_08065 [Jatrophihabitans sp. DSM 45814]
MHLELQVQRVGAQYRGSLTRSRDQLCLGFDGVLELVAAIERFERDEPDETDELAEPDELADPYEGNQR